MTVKDLKEFLSDKDENAIIGAGYTVGEFSEIIAVDLIKSFSKSFFNEEDGDFFIHPIDIPEEDMDAYEEEVKNLSLDPAIVFWTK